MASLDLHVPTARAIAGLLYPHAEVVLHDLATNRIAAIFNNFSRRKAGDESLIDDLEQLGTGPDVHGPFEKASFDGRAIKYTSAVLRDEAGAAIGLLCINLDVSVLSRFGKVLEEFVSAVEDSKPLDDLFADDWQEKIDAFVRRYLRDRELVLDHLTREARTELVRALEAAGGFRGKNAAAYVANVLGVSRATVYSDLAQADPQD